MNAKIAVLAAAATRCVGNKWVARDVFSLDESAPANEAVLRAAREIEDGTIRPGMDNLERLLDYAGRVRR